MTSATLIYPHQLFQAHPALCKTHPVYLIEEPLLLSYNPIHKAKLVLHKLSMDAYQRWLESSGYDVHRITLESHSHTHSVFEKLSADGIEHIHVADTVDHYLEKVLAQAEIKHGLKRVWYETPYFLLEKHDALTRFEQSKKFMANFYKQLRKDWFILMDGDQPRGGKWSFDEDNRKKIPKTETLPEDIRIYANEEVNNAMAWAESVDVESYGDTVCWLPYTFEGAERYLQAFLETRFEKFGPYEDAITKRGVRLWHSTLSPLLNIGLLTPKHVLDAALAYADEHEVPLNSLEGFVRQIIGWREFIRASYEADGSHMRTRNFWAHSRKLKPAFWTGETGIVPVDHAVKTALAFGFNHHIDRLMVMGNVMLLSETDPDEVYRWFMGMYLDAYDWVMVPNVYGMSQFADGGSFATKPYISGSNYIKKMSDHKGGDWEKVLTGLYWHFINKHLSMFKSNHRLSMMPRLLERMKPETRKAHFEQATAFLNNA